MSLSGFYSVDRAKRHPIVSDKPAVDFFEGALMGNGGLGLVVCTRPDSLYLHFGHNAVWDIRLAENNREKIGTFAEIFDKMESINRSGKKLSEDAWLKQYQAMASENYSKPYPRPFPCGSLILSFDLREAELLGHRLDISTGVCEIDFLVNGKPQVVRLFIEPEADRLWIAAFDDAGKPVPSPFKRVTLEPDPETPKELPAFTISPADSAHALWFTQKLPAKETNVSEPVKEHPDDRYMTLTLRTPRVMAPGERTNTWDAKPQKTRPLERYLQQATDPFVACIELTHGLASEMKQPPIPDSRAAFADGAKYDDALSLTQKSWQTFWNQSGVVLDGDPFLEMVWYQNLYFLNCSVRAGVTCPGLFANWSWLGIGSAWHGDYHMNYNTQQPFWVTFSSNHVDKHLPYVDMVDHLLPISQKWAKEYYGLRGAFFPHSAYPVKMEMMPYPVPDWGWEVCETPWTVQSLWWHYTYTMDKDFLRDRAFGPIKEAVLFLVDYMRRPDGHGGKRWKDDKYHIFPTVAPEMYSLTDHFDKNFDVLVDLTLTKFVLNAFLEACDALKVEKEESELVSHARDILAHYPDYLTAQSQRGEVFITVPDENPEIIFNTPNPTMTVFPGEEHGLHSPKKWFDIALNTYRNAQNEGGNELVFRNLQGARLGALDLERFKRQVRYCMLPNGACTDMTLQAQGRYHDALNSDFMKRMGIWFENFGLPAVINECLMQGYDGLIELFPNWLKDRDAEFHTLRTAGAFLVSAKLAGGKVQWIEITSECGGELRVNLPWTSGAKITTPGGDNQVKSKKLTMPTTPGQVIRLTPA